MRLLRILSPGRIILVATLIVAAYLLFSAGDNALHSFRLAGEEARLQEKVERLRQQQEQLLQIRDYLRTDEYVEFMARRVFGLVKPGETLVAQEGGDLGARMSAAFDRAFAGGADQVAIDAIAARIMGFDPVTIPYLRMCHERGLGVADPREIEIVGDPDAAGINMGFTSRRSLVIWGDQLIRRGPLRPLKRLLLHSPLVVWAPFASNVYHDLLWYPTIGRARIRAFAATPWGRLFERY